MAKPTATTPPPPELLSFLETLPEPHILFGTDYRILAANAAYRRQFSPRASVVGRTCHAVSHHIDVPCDQAGESCPLARARRSGQREQVLHLHHTPQGEAYVQIALTPLRDASGQPAFFIEQMQALPMATGSASGTAVQGLIGRSPAFQQMLERVARVAPSQASVLLLGESGTGKELVARAVHEGSPRASAPLVVVDCASLPETLFENELFGHERGAFTGASGPRAGLVESAHGGTLFLDEVGDIPLSIQVKLLRLLESGTFRRVGGTELKRADLRVVAATHRDLQAMVADGRFREDLYFRLSVFPIRLPALRERAGDVRLLAAALLARVAHASQRARRLVFAPAALALLEQQAFPGNVRELRNVVERAALLCDGDTITAAHVADALEAGWARPAGGARRAGPSMAEKVSVQPDDAGLARARSGAVTDDELRQHLARHAGRRADLARALGWSQRTLYRRLAALGDAPDEGRQR
ncbi:sigma-54-dependent Fis family transcriptional regulator [Ideonella sp. DXS22W]|uniref:Sigma-54-dependent Fis family transcriptional regulator n=1 Tax=Pseudaquabacterium inlustre TaxID=2984192 RepID=A0ABU9CKI2_9BURK